MKTVTVERLFKYHWTRRGESIWKSRIYIYWLVLRSWSAVFINLKITMIKPRNKERQRYIPVIKRFNDKSCISGLYILLNRIYEKWCLTHAKKYRLHNWPIFCKYSCCRTKFLVRQSHKKHFGNHSIRMARKFIWRGIRFSFGMFAQWQYLVEIQHSIFMINNIIRNPFYNIITCVFVEINADITILINMHID